MKRAFTYERLPGRQKFRENLLERALRRKTVAVRSRESIFT
jgi:hypothetical protein